MKKSLYLLCFAAVSVPLVSYGTTLPATKTPPGARPSVTESNVVPRSVFVVPSNKADGRDPFVPNSSGGAAVVVQPDKSTGPAIALVYNGRSGTAEKPLAMINGRTFEPGETGDISIPGGGGRITVRCIEIKEKSVVVEIVSTKQQQELQLRGN